MIFQEPTTSLNPCFTIGFQITESLRQHLGLDRKAASAGPSSSWSRSHPGGRGPALGLSASALGRHEPAGDDRHGDRLQPALLIADEPTTALDVTIQAQILDLLLSLQRERGMALVLITHNMGVVAETADRMMVMFAGQVMEESRADALFATPQHPYTAALLAALPERSEGGRLATIPGVVPGLYDRPSGCLFAPRCTYATDHSREERPALRPWQDGFVRCHYPLGDPSRDIRIRQDHPVGASADRPATAEATP